MAKKNRPDSARAEALARSQAEQRRKETRTRIITWGAIAVVVVGLAVGAGVVISNAASERAALEDAAAAPIEGVEEIPDQSADHVTGLPEPTPEPETGTLLPPTGGEHDPVWLNCGVYTDQVPAFNAVHSLEHGAVWVTYAPGLEDAQVASLRDAVQPYDYTILSPFADLASPVVLTAWGVQLEVDDASDERIEVFLAKYVQGEQTPEPGAACSGGIGDPA